MYFAKFLRTPYLQNTSGQMVPSKLVFFGTSSDRPIEVKGHQRRASGTNIFKSKIIELRDSGKIPKLSYGYVFRTVIAKSNI